MPRLGCIGSTPKYFQQLVQCIVLKFWHTHPPQEVSGEKALYIGAYYRPNVKDSESLAAMTSSVTNLTNHTQSHTWLTGDFNLPDIMWENGSVNDGSQYRKHHQDFLDFLVSASLSQMVQTPTRGENTLDLFATNHDTLVTRCDTIPVMSDHDCVLVESRLRPKKFRVRRGTFPVWKKANWNDIKTHINEAWGRLPQDQKDNSTSDSLWVWFQTTLEGAIQKHVPHRQVKGKGRHPWISRSLKRLMRKEAKLFSKKKHQPTQHNISRHKQAQRQIQKKFRQEYWTYINQILFSPTDKDTPPDKKTLWNYIKHCKKDSIGVGTLRDNTSGELLTKPRRKAELLNDQFQSVFSHNTPLILKHLCQQATRLMPARETSEERRHPIMPDFTISSNAISKLLKKLKPNKAAGPDKIRPLVLWEPREEIAPILEAIFTKSLDTGKLPDDWKSANVVQRYSARWTLGRYHNRSSVTDMLNYLGWRSLEMRRVDTHMSMMYKMSNGLVAVDTTSYLVHPVWIAASAHPHHFIVSRTFNQLHLNSFFPRSVRQWNALLDTVARAPSLESFKQRVCQINHSA